MAIDELVIMAMIFESTSGLSLSRLKNKHNTVLLFLSLHDAHISWTNYSVVQAVTSLHRHTLC